MRFDTHARSKTRAHRGFSTTRAWLLLFFAACGPVDLAVVVVPDAGSVAPVTTPCSGSGDCRSDEICEKSACGDALGECTARPPVCGDDLQPECGCDGVTYMNDCLRRLSGVEALREHGPCRMPTRCDPQNPCPGEAKCARIGPPGTCGTMMRGACWRVASACAASPDEHYESCDGLQCLNLCGAVNSGQPFERSPGPCP